MRSLFALLLVLACALSFAGCDDDGRVTSAGLLSVDGGERVYVALGDSIAAGTGASAPELGYVALVAEALREQLDDGIELRNLAAGGHTTQDVIDEQLETALALLAQGDVVLLTVTIGGNDLDIVQDSPDAAACIADVRDPLCPVAGILLGTEERLDRILGELRGVAPDTPVAIQVYPNLFSGTGHLFEQPAETAFAMLNEVIERVASRHDVLIADPRAAFAGRGGELTHTLDPTPDFHPNDAGHGVIADAFLEALGLTGE